MNKERNIETLTNNWSISGNEENYTIDLKHNLLSIRSNNKKTVSNSVVNLSKAISRSLYTDTSLATIYFKYRSLDNINGYPFLGFDVINRQNGISNKRLKEIKTPSSNEWRDDSLKIDVGSGSSAIIITIGLLGDGKVEFSKLQIVLDEKYSINLFDEETSRMQPILVPGYIYPQVNYESDTLPSTFQNALNLSKIVALGEFSHGSKEVLKDRSDMFKYLVKKHNYSILCMEIDMSTSEFINSYLVNDSLSIEEIIESLPLVMRTNEILDVFKWIKKYNETNSKSILVYGYDIKSSNVSFLNLKRFTSNLNDSSLLNQIFEIEKTNKAIFDEYRIHDSQIQSINASLFNDLSNASQELRNYFELNRNSLVKKSGVAEYEWAYQNINLISQFGQSFYDYNLGHEYVFNSERDSSMYLNIEWIKNKYPESKIVVWGHNNHIKKSIPSLGHYLQENYRDEFISIGYASYQGTYSAEQGAVLASGFNLTNATKGSYESIFHEINSNGFILDIREANKSGVDFVKKIRLFRSIGAYPTSDQFQHYSNLSSDYDYIIFIDKTNSSKPLE